MEKSERLAIQGGPPAVPEGMVKSWPVITEEDKQAVLGVLESGHLHGVHAPQALALQEEWAEYCGVKYCLVTNSGTSALHLALVAAGLGPGDEVIVPAFTFWASAAAVLHQNAIPVFVDIEGKTFCIDPDKIEEKITERTKAIMPVHVHGMPCDMDPIIEIAHRHNLYVIEDACQAHGAEYKGRRAGGLGDAAGFSLNRSKNLTGCEGGLMTTNRDDWHEFAARAREFGEVIIPGKEREYNAYMLGWMYRPVEMVNAFARSQLKRLDEYNATRRQLAGFLNENLAEIPGVEPPYTPPERLPVYFSYVVEFRPDELGLDVPPKDFTRRAEAALRAEGVPMGKWQTMPVPAQDVFQNRIGYGKGCPWTCRWYGKEIIYREEDYPQTLKFLNSHSYVGGVYPPNTIELMECYIKAFRKVMSQPEVWAVKELSL